MTDLRFPRRMLSLVCLLLVGLAYAPGHEIAALTALRSASIFLIVASWELIRRDVTPLLALTLERLRSVLQLRLCLVRAEKR